MSEATKHNERIIDFSDDAERARVIAGLDKMRGVWRVTFTKFRRRRSDEQNKYLWSVVYPTVRDGMKETWHVERTVQEVHCWLRGKFLTFHDVDQSTGGRVPVQPSSTSDLSVEEFTHYIDQIRQFADKHLNVYVPTPQGEGVAA